MTRIGWPPYWLQLSASSLGGAKRSYARPRAAPPYPTAPPRLQGANCTSALLLVAFDHVPIDLHADPRPIRHPHHPVLHLDRAVDQILAERMRRLVELEHRLDR